MTTRKQATLDEQIEVCNQALAALVRQGRDEHDEEYRKLYARRRSLQHKAAAKLGRDFDARWKPTMARLKRAIHIAKKILKEPRA